MAKKFFTKTEIRKAIKDEDFNFFIESDYANDAEIVYELSLGDGHAITRTYYFKDADLYVTIEGTYSSWDGTDWEDVYLSEPYQVVQTLYRRKKK